MVAASGNLERGTKSQAEAQRRHSASTTRTVLGTLGSPAACSKTSTVVSLCVQPEEWLNDPQVGRRL